MLGDGYVRLGFRRRVLQIDDLSWRTDRLGDAVPNQQYTVAVALDRSQVVLTKTMVLRTRAHLVEGGEAFLREGCVANCRRR